MSFFFVVGSEARRRKGRANHEGQEEEEAEGAAHEPLEEDRASKSHRLPGSPLTTSNERQGMVSLKPQACNTSRRWATYVFLWQRQGPRERGR
jgi:hypothetical protein